MNWCSDSKGITSSRGCAVCVSAGTSPGLLRGDDERGLGRIALDLEPIAVAHELGIVVEQAGEQRLAQGLVLIERGALSGGQHFAARFVAGAGHVVEFSAGENLLHGHLVLRERAGLVRADDGGAAERFDGGKFADDRAAFRHARDADGERDGDRRGQSLRDRADREGDRGHEHLDRAFAARDADRKRERRRARG